MPDCKKITCCPPENFGYEIPSEPPNPEPIENFTVILTVSPGGTGTTTGSGDYPSGTFATIEAIPDTGKTFTGWSGDFVSTDNPAQVFVNSDKAIVANFAVSNVILTTIANPTSGGTITGGGIYAFGATANIEAFPTTNLVFDNWTGDISTTDNPTTVLMDGNKTVTANFILPSWTLTINPSPPDGGVVTGAGTYSNGTEVVITAFPADGQEFVGWTGDLVSSNNPDTITMDANKIVTAVFGDISYDLLVVPSPSEGGIVGVSGGYSAGVSAPVFATPNPGWLLAGWAGDLSGSVNPTTILMDSDKTVIAVLVYVNGENPFD